MPQVDILMATYNGARYVKSQIYSILSQTFTDWRLIIHDDRSTDNTIQIIREFSHNDPRIILIEDGVRFGNAGENFLHLIHFSDADYIMFCDQDDIWFDNKISVMLEHIQKLKQEDCPLVIYSNSYVWAPNSGISGLATLTYPQDLRAFLFLNSGMQGCCAMFNAKARQILSEWKGHVSMHDHLLHLIGISMGIVSYIHLPLMLYRQHECNVTGEARVHINALQSFIKNRKIPVVSTKHYETVARFYKQYEIKFEKSDSNIFKAYLNMAHQRLFSRLVVILRYRFKLYNSISALIMKIICRSYI